MEIILLEKVENLGNIGDRVKVRAGYGRNFLLPQGKASLATPENVAAVEARRAEFEQREAEELAAARARGRQLEALKVRITARAGTDGKLFGSVGTVDIAEACTLAGVEIQRSEVRLPDGPLRLLGEHEVEFHLHSDVNTLIVITVVEEAEIDAPDLNAEAVTQAGAEAASGTAED